MGSFNVFFLFLLLSYFFFIVNPLNGLSRKGDKNALIDLPPQTFTSPRRRALSARIQELNRSLLEERDGRSRYDSSDMDDK